MIQNISPQEQLLGRSNPSLTMTSLTITPACSTTLHNTRCITNKFNLQYKNYVETLGVKKNQYQTEVNKALKKDPYYSGHRDKGVKLAWEYEKADIEMGGRGSEKWTTSEREDILNRGTVRNAEGHHRKNVAHHPEDQADPDNIKFYRNRKQHLEEGHNGNFQNESDQPKMDKEQMLRDTNRRRVVKNELQGAGLAAIIGFATGASIGFILSLVQNGVSPDSLVNALEEGAIAGVEGASLSIVSYGISRLFGNITTAALTGALTKMGVDVTENIAKACNMGTVGVIVIIATSIYSYIKLRRNGSDRKEALQIVGKQILISVASLAATVIVQSVYGGPAAIAVGIGISAILLGYSMYKVYHNKKLADKIQIYSIEKSYKSLEYDI